MKELKKAFYDVMYKYHKPFTEDGVMANLRAWKKYKAPLLELLRRHPNWNEQAKAIVFDYEQGRGIDPNAVDELCFVLTELAYEIIPAEQQNNFSVALLAAVSEYQKTPSEEKLEIIRQSGGIKCATGQKTSRIIGKLCKQFGVDKHQRYNSVYAQLADAFSPLQMQNTVVFSLHPCDFLEMSNKENTWYSCHNLESGSWQAGCLSYMTDGVTIILYTVDEGVKQDYHKALRRNRQVFFYQDNMLYQSRLYPDGNDELMTQYRTLAQNAIAACLGVPDLWVLKVKREELTNCYKTVDGSCHYKDYHNYGNLSLLKGTVVTSPFQIGSPPICLCCGETYFNKNKTKCTDCENRSVCADCGQTAPQSLGRYLDGAFHCNACIHTCSACGNVTAETMYPAFNRRGMMVEVCHSCYQTAIEPCSTCSTESVCQLFGRALCPRTALHIA